MLATESLIPRQQREVVSTPKTSLLEAKDKDRLVFWGQSIVGESSQFVIVKFSAELHPTLRTASWADLEDLGLILDGESKLAVNGKDYWEGPTSRFLKYMIRIKEGTGMRLVIQDGKDIHASSQGGLYVSDPMPVAFTMDFKGRLRSDSPWAIRACLLGQGVRPVG